MLARAIFSLLLSISTLPCIKASPCPPRPSPLPLSELSPELLSAGEKWAQLLLKSKDEAGIPSIQWQANYRDQIISSGATGWADIESSTPATSETLYRIGSVSKLFTTVLMYQLAEAGRIGLDDKLIEYLPDFSIFDPFDMSEGKGITLRHLANHLSGMGRSSPLGMDDLASSVQVLKTTAGLIHPVNLLHESM